MSGNPARERIASCRCGNVALALAGEPIVASNCYCTSCQTAAARFETLEGAHPILEADGGTPYVLFRKDRVRPLRGESLLREHRLKPSSSTRRVVASCCNTPIFTEFQNGHWLSVYSHTLPEAERPPVDLRTMTVDRRPGVEFHDAVPSYRRHSGRFMCRLLAAWAAMSFRAPKIDWVKGALDEKTV
jgi:hypothetical protein